MNKKQLFRSLLSGRLANYRNLYRRNVHMLAQSFTHSTVNSVIVWQDSRCWWLYFLTCLHILMYCALHIHVLLDAVLFVLFLSICNWVRNCFSLQLGNGILFCGADFIDLCLINELKRLAGAAWVEIWQTNNTVVLCTYRGSYISILVPFILVHPSGNDVNNAPHAYYLDVKPPKETNQEFYQRFF